MKKSSKIAIVVAIVAVVAIIAVVAIFMNKGKEATGETKADNKTYKIGETIQNDKFTMTLKSVEFVDFIDMHTKAHPDPVFGGYKIGADTFCSPADNENGSMTADEGNAILFYTLEYKFIGKSQYYAYSDFGKPIVKYDKEYTFSDNYLSARNKGDGWTIFCVDDNKMRTVGMLASGSQYEPLDDTTYLVRGAIQVPEKLKNDTEKSLTIQFNELGKGTYKIR